MDSIEHKKHISHTHTHTHTHTYAIGPILRKNYLNIPHSGNREILKNWTVR